MRAVQQARKDAGLDVSDRIALVLGGDEDVLAALRTHEALVAGRRSRRRTPSGRACCPPAPTSPT
ncbi:DUF5915 domain-containing protein [Nocardioides zeae]